jgi:hypothetical protein
MNNNQIPNPRIAERKKAGPHLTKNEQVGFNGRLAVIITKLVGTMWCAYIFAAIALISLPAAIRGGTAPLVAWVSTNIFAISSPVSNYGWTKSRCGSL